jgi:hypothetical protein
LRVDTNNLSQSAKGVKKQKNQQESSNGSHVHDEKGRHRALQPENLKRTQYLNVITETPPVIKEKSNQPGCWTVTTWILTWWAPSFMLKVFGKKIKALLMKMRLSDAFFFFFLHECMNA